jgi:Methylamine utilisation protein MauE
MPSLDPIVPTVAILTVAAVFAASAAMKFVALDEFEGALADYRLAPRVLEAPLTRLLPALEAAGALAILIPAARAAGCALLLGLLALFTAAIAINLARGRRAIDCGCFGPALRQPLSDWLLARNALLALVLVAAAAPANQRALTRLDLATAGFSAAALVLLYAAMNYLLANWSALAAVEVRDD